MYNGKENVRLYHYNDYYQIYKVHLYHYNNYYQIYNG